MQLWSFALFLRSGRGGPLCQQLLELPGCCVQRAVVVVEHDMDFVRRLNCKVTVLHEGAVLAEGSLDHVTKNQAVIDVYLGRG